jgi:superfamily II DNA or RNA helicase
VIHACGTGKTLTALWTKEALGSRRTIVFCPSLSLVDQTMREWQAHKSAPFTAVVVCSDQSIGGSDSEGEGASALELAMPPTTHAGQLREAMEAHAEAVVVFATYQSSAVVADAIRGSAFRFDLLIADEAHRTTGPAGGDFHRPLDDAQIGADRRLFLTATPRIYRARTKPDAEGDAVEVVSMDDSAQYGPRFHELSFREAIERDLLSDYRIVIFGVTPGEVEKLIADRAYVTHDGSDVTDAVELATHVGLARAMREFGMRRSISFHSRVKSAGVFADRFRSVADWLPQDQRPDAPVWTAMLSGEDSVHVRRQVLRRLRQGAGGECGLVTNARCLSEGVDVPAIDGIVFVDPKSSTIDIVQAVGRALRKADDKSRVSTIVLPVVISDDATEAITSLEGSTYAHVWRVVDALRSHDEVLGEELDFARRMSSLRTDHVEANLPQKIILRLPQRVSTIFSRAVTIRVLERTTSQWEVGFGHLAAFRAANGHARVPANFVAVDGCLLGNWTVRQRSSADLLSPDRRARLDSLDFVWDLAVDRWEVGYAYLVEYHADHGSAAVPKRHISADGFKLGLWCLRQRAAAGILSSDQRARLDGVGFPWETRRTVVRSTRWVNGYAHLVAFRRDSGHCRVPLHFVTTDDFPLGEWVEQQREAAPRAQLADDRVSQLDALGFVWFRRLADWEDGYEELLIYRAHHGHAVVPPGYVADSGFELGQWAATQLIAYAEDQLSDEHYRLLNDIGIGWNTPEVRHFLGGHRRWREGYVQLEAYHKVHGHCNVLPGLITAGGFHLADWVFEQELDSRCKRLSEYRRARLEALGFVWDAVRSPFPKKR